MHTRAPGRVEYFDVLRAVAIVCVVAVHASITRWHQAPVGSAEWDALTWIGSPLRVCVPLFFMISGALFLAPEKRVSVRSMLTRSVPRLVSTFVLWSLAFACLDIWGPGGSGDGGEFVHRFATGHFHLWFLLALIGLYLVVPLLRPIAADRRLARYFVALAAVFGSVLPLAARLPVAGPVVQDVLDIVQLHLVLGYAGFFVLGHLLATARLTRGGLVAVAAAGTAGVAATVLGTTLVSQSAGEYDELFYGFTTPNVVAMSAAVFCLARAWGDRFALSPAWARTVGFVARVSFGVYLVHPFFQWVYKQFGFTTDIASPWLTVPLLVVAVFVPSMLVAAGLGRLPRRVARYVGG